MKIKKLFLVLCSFLCTSLASCSKGFDYSGYKVTWKDSDGSVIAVQYGVREGKYPICPEGNPSNKSKTKQFIDWSPKRSSVHGDVTYTAVYDDPSNPKTYSIDYHINEYSGERNSAFNVKTYSFGEYVVLYNPIKEGYDFEGWYDENGKQVITLDTYSCKDINLYPRWSIATYYVSFNYYPHELGDPYTETYDYGSYFSAYVLPIDGYEFEGWYKNGNFVTDLYSISFNVNDDVELVARYHALYGVSYDYMHDCYQIDSYYGTSTIITIPTYINGKLIEGISSYAFANSNIKEVTIPWSINYIGGYAFAYSAIESFYVSQGSQLFEIGNYCFLLLPEPR